MGDMLKGKIAVVTGAGRGIGRAEALALAAEGAKIVVNDIGCEMDGMGTSRSLVDEMVAEIKKMGGEAAANYDTVVTAQGGENIIKTAIDAFGGLDILVNNAGILRDRMVFKMSDEEWDLVIKTHLYGHFNCTRPACVWFREQWKQRQKGGRIINTSSLSGLGSVGQVNYCAAKEGIVGFTRGVAVDMARYGVTCNAIRPVAATRMTTMPEAKVSWEALGMGYMWEQTAKLVPEGVPPLVVFLATDEAAQITGRVFRAMEGHIGIYPEPAEMRSLHKVGRWTLDELRDLIPKTLALGLAKSATSASSG